MFKRLVIITFLMMFCIAGTLMAKPSDAECILLWKDFWSDMSTGNEPSIPDCDLYDALYPNYEPGDEKERPEKLNEFMAWCGGRFTQCISGVNDWWAACDDARIDCKHNLGADLLYSCRSGKMTCCEYADAAYNAETCDRYFIPECRNNYSYTSCKMSERYCREEMCNSTLKPTCLDGNDIACKTAVKLCGYNACKYVWIPRCDATNDCRASKANCNGYVTIRCEQNYDRCMEGSGKCDLYLLKKCGYKIAY
jgi:hypothetical protein